MLERAVVAGAGRADQPPRPRRRARRSRRCSASFQGALVCVSHDREFLDGCATHVLEVAAAACAVRRATTPTGARLRAAERARELDERDGARQAARPKAAAPSSPAAPAAPAGRGGAACATPTSSRELEQRIIALEEELAGLHGAARHRGGLPRRAARLEETQVRSRRGRARARRGERGVGELGVAGHRVPTSGRASRAAPGSAYHAPHGHRRDPRVARAHAALPRAGAEPAGAHRRDVPAAELPVRRIGVPLRRPLPGLLRDPARGGGAVQALAGRARAGRAPAPRAGVVRRGGAVQLRHLPGALHRDRDADGAGRDRGREVPGALLRRAAARGGDGRLAVPAPVDAGRARGGGSRSPAARGSRGTSCACPARARADRSRSSSRAPRRTWPGSSR